MRKIKLLFLICFLNFFLISCQTVKEKTDAIVEKENKKLSQYIGKSSDELKTELGNPDEDYKNENGNIELVYKTKKYEQPQKILGNLPKRFRQAAEAFCRRLGPLWRPAKKGKL